MRPRDDVQEARWRAEFAADPALQREFGGSCEAWIAFRRNEHRSRVLGERREPAPTARAQHDVSPGDVRLSAAPPAAVTAAPGLAATVDLRHAAAILQVPLRVLDTARGRALLQRSGIVAVQTPRGERFQRQDVDRLARDFARRRRLCEDLALCGEMRT